MSPVPRPAYRVPMPFAGRWREVLNTDSDLYGGANLGNMGGVVAGDTPWGAEPASAELVLPPLGVVWLVPES